MCDDDQSAFICLELLLQPCCGFIVNVVGRLVQNQNFTRIDERRANCYALFLSAGQQPHIFIKIRDAELCQ